MRIDLKETTLNVEQAGEGNPLLLIHGFPFTHEIWRPQLETLSRGARVIAPDLRGHGGSPPTPGPYSMNMLADDCADLLEELGVQQPVTVCGLSMGGYASFAFYRRHPEKVAGLVLTSTRAGADSDETRNNRDQAAKLVGSEGTQAVIENMLPILMSPVTYQEKPGLVAQVENIMQQTTPEGMIAALMGMKIRPDSTPSLAKIEVPTLIIHGADDQIIPEQEASAMHGSIPGSILEIIPQAGHLPNLEQEQAFNQVLESFLLEVG